MQITDDPNNALPTAVRSRREMRQHLPDAAAYLKRKKAADLAEMLFGEDNILEEAS